MNVQNATIPIAQRAEALTGQIHAAQAFLRTHPAPSPAIRTAEKAVERAVDNLLALLQSSPAPQEPGPLSAIPTDNHLHGVATPTHVQIIMPRAVAEALLTPLFEYTKFVEQHLSLPGNAYPPNSEDLDAFVKAGQALAPRLAPHLWAHRDEYGHPTSSTDTRAQIVRGVKALFEVQHLLFSLEAQWTISELLGESLPTQPSPSQATPEAPPDYIKSFLVGNP